jgi:hypothetical protein
MSSKSGPRQLSMSLTKYKGNWSDNPEYVPKIENLVLAHWFMYITKVF